MSPAIANFLFEAANFLVLAAMLGWVLFKPVRAALDREHARHTEAETRAAELRAEAEHLAEEAREAHQRLAGELETRRAEALAAARKEAARIKDEARQARDQQSRALEHEMRVARQAQAGALADTLGQIAARSVRRLLEQLDGPALDLALARAACRELAALPAAAGETATVESARPLDAESARLLREVLGDGFGERVVPELGAGVRVTTPAGQVDSSALALARQAAHEVAAVTGAQGG